MRYNQLLSFLFLLSGYALAQERDDIPAPVPVSEQNQTVVDTSVIRELGNEYHNSIQLLSNRFRVDYTVDEVTLVFFRRFGSAPVVLVRPDGSKIFQSQADGEGLFWYDTANYDMISLKNPMPGPWQAVGQILPESRVMVLSDLQLHAEPLPPILFSGEILKQTAYLTNNGAPINYTEFRDVVTLEMKFVSTNNPNFNNFGADEEVIATFEDNGRGMDEEPRDGVFTGQFNLSVADGEWRPTFLVNTPMFSREQIDEAIRLYPNPVKIDVVQDGGGDGYHKLLIDVDRELVDINTLLVDGKVRFPNGDVQNFSLTQQSPNTREHMIVNFEYGVYRIKLTAYGNTVNGRDFILDVPEYTFLAEVPESTDTQATDVGTDLESAIGADMPNDTTAADAMPVEEEAPSMSSSEMLYWILGINFGLLLVGGGIIWFLMRDKSPKAESVAAPEKGEDSKEKMSIMDKVKAMLPSKKKKDDTSTEEKAPEIEA
ncbi:TIGR03503 family protein [Aestuariibacter sp. AA17]|uniref:TIGR03503 family protein n=1 Tax=Fluctibacter corallii TaxID=2984329 RepID=A0ABT3A5P9_9ALTE|nr:TIGR03503 family protein [Aestuariibacter sp. AA17]MCV2884007.1 TIGR03503 family protein [Aestuariibacter sp. AA17]